MKSDRETTKKKTIKNMECENHLLDLRDEEIKSLVNHGCDCVTLL